MVNKCVLGGFNIMIEWKQDENNSWYNTCNKSCMLCDRIVWENCEKSCELQEGWDCENCLYYKNKEC